MFDQGKEMAIENGISMKKRDHFLFTIVSSIPRIVASTQ